MDLSHLDKKYFIDTDVYNCPFCKRNNVKYGLIGNFRFDWTLDKQCYGYLIKCSSCNNISLHLSFNDIRQNQYSSVIDDNSNSFNMLDIDSKIFYSRPSSFFTLDNRIPDQIRKLIFEAEESRQSNFLIGASACLRKAIYELLSHEKSIIRNEKTGYADYQKSVKNLENKFKDVDKTLFDALSNIQEMSCDPLHEESSTSWNSSNLRFLIELSKTILEEIYVIPNERKRRLDLLGQMKNKLDSSKKTR